MTAESDVQHSLDPFDVGALSQGQADEIARITWIGAGLNVGLTLLKAVSGVLAGSRALVADAVHSLSDLATDAALIIGVRYWTAPADREHPYGHQKIETLITMVIGLALLAVGLGLGYEAGLRLYGALAGASGGVRPSEPGAVTLLALSAAAISIVSKEILYRWTAAKGRVLGSSALLANAWHHRSDALSSVPPLLAIGGGALGRRLNYDLWFLDPIGTLAVCLMLLVAAWGLLRPTLASLIDAGADQQLYAAIRETVLSTPGILSTHKIRTRCLCSGLVAVDLHIQVDGNLSVTEGHDLASEVQFKILGLKVDGLEARAVDVVVHVEPAQSASGYGGSL